MGLYIQIQIGDSFKNLKELTEKLKEFGYTCNIRKTTLAKTKEGFRIVYKDENSSNTTWTNFYNPQKKELLTYALQENVSDELKEKLPSLNEKEDGEIIALFYKHKKANYQQMECDSIVEYLGSFKLIAVSKRNIFIQIWKKQDNEIQI